MQTIGWVEVGNTKKANSCLRKQLEFITNNFQVSRPLALNHAAAASHAAQPLATLQQPLCGTLLYWRRLSLSYWLRLSQVTRPRALGWRASLVCGGIKDRLAGTNLKVWFSVVLGYVLTHCQTDSLSKIAFWTGPRVRPKRERERLCK